jgi:hypothetical protein
MRTFDRTYVAFVAASAVFMVAVLLLDGEGFVRQLALGGATAAFLWLFARRLNVDRRQIVCAIVVASLGEVFLSLVWGLYTYQHALIPAYVPPGHGLFYALAAATAAQRFVREHASTITRWVVAAGTLNALISLVMFRDTWGLLWWLGALALIARSRNRLLLSACFVYTLLLEWAGTAIGNWRWSPVVPWVGLHSANPPAGVGILYILLDLIVVAVATRLATRSVAGMRVPPDAPDRADLPAVSMAADS